MPVNSDGSGQPCPTRRDLSRRGFVGAAGAAAAGAAMLGGPFVRTAFAVPKKVHSKVKRPTCVATVTDGEVVTSDDNGRLILWHVNGNATGPALSSTNHGGKKAAFVTF